MINFDLDFFGIATSKTDSDKCIFGSGGQKTPDSYEFQYLVVGEPDWDPNAPLEYLELKIPPGMTSPGVPW